MENKSSLVETIHGIVDMKQERLAEVYFRSIPWVNKLLSDPAYIITPTFSRHFKASREDSLLAETLQTPKTIKHCLSSYLRPPTNTKWISEIRTFFTLSSGMNGGPNALHGGIIATLMDDVIGTLLTINKDEETINSGTVTGTLSVKYLRKVMTPQTVVVVAKCKEVRDRKIFMEAEVRDSEGNVLAKADSMWIKVRGVKAVL
ncbi:HotDog domain-containing protein [Tricladium varicosporioides]|nr:HotDog domain-containing protein [Hymenoscyphus varicosporioides]